MSDSHDHDDDVSGDERLLAQLRGLDAQPAHDERFWQTMAQDVRAAFEAQALPTPPPAIDGHEALLPRTGRSLPRLRRRWAAASGGLALAAAFAIWLSPKAPPPAAVNAGTLDDVTVIGDELGPGDELEEMNQAQLDELDRAFKHGGA